MKRKLDGDNTARPQSAKKTKRTGAVPSVWYRKCVVCECYLSGPTDLASHENGKRHAKQLVRHPVKEVFISPGQEVKPEPVRTRAKTLSSFQELNLNVKDNKKHVLLALTGSVAAIKALDLYKALSALATVKIIVTENAKSFLPEGMPAVMDAKTEWHAWNKRGDPIVHIELRKWADLMVVAPLSANTLAKLSNGLCDSLLTSVVRAWDYNKPLLLAPAMNTFMWNHPITSQQTMAMQSFGAEIFPVVTKTLMCGDEGPGAMVEVATIVNKVREQLEKM